MSEPWAPARRTLALAAAGMTLFAICGSIVPFFARELTLDEAVRRFGIVLTMGPSAASRADSLANVLLYLPVAYLWMAALTVDRDARYRLRALPFVVVFISLLTVVLEFVQLWLPARVVSLNDVYAGTAGSLAGTALWLFSGQPVTDWIRTITPATRPRQSFDRTLLILVIALVGVSLLPLDLTLSARALFEKVRTGGVMLMPLDGVTWTPAGLVRLVLDAALFIPAGMWLATWRTTAARPVRDLRTTIVAGALFGTLIETAQFLVLNRVSATTDVMTATLGVAIGWRMLRAWLPVGIGAGATSHPAPAPKAHAPVTGVAWARLFARLTAASLYAALILIALCAPFAVEGSKEVWRDRYRAIWSLRLHDVVPATLAAAAEDAGQAGLFAGLGVLLVLAGLAARPPRSVRPLLLVVTTVMCAAVAAAVEVVQVLLPSRVPTNVDIALAVIGAAIGGALTLWTDRT